MSGHPRRSRRILASKKLGDNQQERSTEQFNVSDSTRRKKTLKAPPQKTAPTPKISKAASQKQMIAAPPVRTPVTRKKVTRRQTARVPSTANNDYYKDEKKRFSRKYVMTKKILGKGAFGTVVLGSEKNQGRNRRNRTKVAIKKPHVAGEKHDETAEELVHHEALEEVKIWSRLSSDPSPFILPLLDSFVLSDPNGLPTLYTVTPYMEHGDLEQYIERLSGSKEVRDGGLPDTETSIIGRQLLSAVQHMAACGVVHRDIKPDNMMVVLRRNCKTLDFVKISLMDFGTAKFYREGEDDPLQSNVGTDWFQAPEVEVGQGYGIAAEVFSIGQTLKVTYRGYWTDDRLRDQYIQDADNDVYKVLWYRHWNLEQASLGLETDELWQKIRKLTVKDLQERPSLEEALQMFRNTPRLTDEQSGEFKSAVHKILKVVIVGYLSPESNAVVPAVAGQCELHEARSTIAGLQRDLEAAKERVQTVLEFLQERLESQDARN